MRRPPAAARTAPAGFRGRACRGDPGHWAVNSGVWRLPAGSAPGAGASEEIDSEEHRSMNPVQRPDSFEAADYVGVLRRRWWIVLAPACRSEEHTSEPQSTSN